MTSKTYDRVTMTCMAVAAISALLFDKFSQARLAILFVGVLAATVAVVIYFRNQWTAHEKSEAQGISTEASEVAPPQGSSDPSATVAFLDISDIPSAWSSIGKTFGQPLFYRTALFTSEVERQERPPSVDAVVELVERLFIKRGHEYEITVHSHGHFTIRPMERVSREAEREAAVKPPFSRRTNVSELTGADTERAIAEWAHRQGLPAK